MRLDLEQMTISAFKNFDVDQTVVFPTSQITAIVGQDKDDGGSNGTGKSSFSVTPLVNLFGAKYAGVSIKNLENRYLNQSARLVGNYKIDGIPLHVDRTLGGALSFTYDGVPNKPGKAEAVQAELNTILKIAPEQLAALSSKVQGETGGFLMMTDAAKKDFLSSFFDVTSIEHAKDLADKELAEKEKTLSATNGKVDYVSGVVMKLSEQQVAAQQRLAEVDTEDYRKTIKALKDQLAALNSNKTALESVLSQPAAEFATYAKTFDEVMKAQGESSQKLLALSTQIEDVKRQIEAQVAKEEELKLKIYNIPAVPNDLTAQLKQADDILKVFDARRSKITQISGQRIATEMQLKVLKDELNKADSAKCSSCGTPLSEDKCKEMRSKVEAGIPYLQTNLDSMDKQITELTVSGSDQLGVQMMKEEMLHKISTFKAENSTEVFKKELQAATSLRSSLTMTKMGLEQSFATESRVVDQAVARVRAGIESALFKLNFDILQVNEETSKKESEIQARQRELDRINVEHTKSGEELYNLVHKAAELDDQVDTLTRVTKITSKSGFIGYIFDSMLEDLNSVVNEELKKIPNARKFSLQFSSDKLVAKTGAINKAITYQMFSGTEVVEFDTLSGGEKLSVILAVDESLDTVLSERLGVSIGWKFLDEQFYWIDENSKEAILDFYRTKSFNRAYFIIDHASEFNAAFDNKITIVKTNNIARFTA